MIKNKSLIMGLAIMFSLVFALSSTYAWFSAKDEVVNHLQTAKLTDGDVTIIETFDPEDPLEPGVAVNKQVGAINTGAADALVRMSFAEALLKLATGEQVRNELKYAGATTEIPELVNIAAYPTTGADPWIVMEDTSFTLTDDSAAFTALPEGITVVYKATATTGNTNATKYRFAAYAALSDGTYQRVEVLPEAFNVIDGKLKITLNNGLTGVDKANYFNFITLALAPKAEHKWANFTGTGTLQTLPGAHTFAALTTEPSTPLNPNIATASLSSAYIQLIFGSNVITTIDTATPENNNGKWFYNANDGWFYYMGALKSGETTGNLLEKVYMTQAAGKDFSHTDYDLTVKMEGIQAVEDAVTSNAGWDLSNASFAGANAQLIAQLQSYC